jgi:hypothetical protein
VGCPRRRSGDGNGPRGRTAVTRAEYDRLLTPAFRVAVDHQTDADLLEEELHALRMHLRGARSGFERQVVVTKMQYIHDRLAEIMAEDQESDT